MGKTFAQKILAIKSGEKDLKDGEIVTIEPDCLMTHDNTSAIIGKISKELREYGLARKEMLAIVLDHVVPAADEKTASGHKKIREFVSEHDVRNFFDIGTGICHQVLFEKGLALPGNVMVGSDSHTCSYGALGAFATGIDRTEAASIMLCGSMWMKVPQSIKIVLKGKFNDHVTAKDLILTIIGDIGADGANYCSVEFHGNVDALDINDRFTIANMGIEMGAKAAVFPIDGVAEKYLSSIGVSKEKIKSVWADPDAAYIKELTYDLSTIKPVIACPHNVDNVKKVSELEGLHIDQVLIGTCTNGRLSDLELAAKILQGKKIATGVRLLILPASRKIYEDSLDKGVFTILSQAGGVVLPPGCGPCLGAHQGVLAPGERCLSTANRNFKGRMGCKEAEIYLVSPEVAAASAIKGCVTDPAKEVL